MVCVQLLYHIAPCFFPPSCETEQVGTLCFTGETFSCFSTDREKDRRMKLRVFIAQLCVLQHEQAGGEQGSRGLELDHTWPSGS